MSRVRYVKMLLWVAAVCAGLSAGGCGGQRSALRGERLATAGLRAVRLPGYEFLSLGMATEAAEQALRERGYACHPGSGPRLQVCDAAQLRRESVVLEFVPAGGGQPARLAAVQVQPGEALSPVQDQLLGRQYLALLATWRGSYGAPQEVRRPGIIADRFLLGDGTALVLVYFGELRHGQPAESAAPAAMTLEHVGLRDRR